MFNIQFERLGPIQVDEQGKTLLEISLDKGVPHYHACGGHARCSTCRVLVLSGEKNLSPPTDAECEMAERKGFGPSVRLACQTRVSGPITVRRLVLDDTDAEEAYSVDKPRCDLGSSSGRETRLAVMFADIRSFTPFSGRTLPYDLVHILNRYFAAAGEAIRQHDGYIDKYLGDGIMALFGLRTEDLQTGCRDAVAAGLSLLDRLERLNHYLEEQFGERFEIGIGIHAGVAVVGSIGHPKRRQLTALGDVVNVASRIESANKEFSSTFLVSDTVFSYVKDRVKNGRKIQASLKGKQGTYDLHEILGSSETGPPLITSTAQDRLRAVLETHISRIDAPSYLRLAFHDAWIRLATGGKSCVTPFSQSLQRKENLALIPNMDILATVKDQFPRVSFGDLIAHAGAYAVERCGGPRIDLQFGQVDRDGPAEDNDFPFYEGISLPDAKSYFLASGFLARDLVALSGAHTLGLASGQPFTHDPFTFNNQYYCRLLAGDTRAFLPSDMGILDDPDCVHWVEEYARDEQLFFDDFADSYRRLTQSNPQAEEAIF